MHMKAHAHTHPALGVVQRVFDPPPRKKRSNVPAARPPATTELEVLGKPLLDKARPVEPVADDLVRIRYVTLHEDVNEDVDGDGNQASHRIAASTNQHPNPIDHGLSEGHGTRCGGNSAGCDISEQCSKLSPKSRTMS